MKKTYYLFNPGRLSRKDHTLKFTPTPANGEKKPAKYLPVQGIKSLYIFGSLDANSALYSFLGKSQIPVHFFDYYQHYTGSFMPKEFLQAGKMQIVQTQHYLDGTKRQTIARRFLKGATHHMLRNLKYYQGRGLPLSETIEQIDALGQHFDLTSSSLEIPELMGIEGNIRQIYYQSFDHIVKYLPFEYRSRQPPHNALNALISFGNMLAYTACLDQIYHTQLNPTISFLHEPGFRRFSLALDLAEIFKPLLVDRLIFSMVNKRQIHPQDFDPIEGSILMTEKTKKTFIQQWDQRLSETFMHRSLKRKISYRTLIRLEVYKLAKHLLGIQAYQPFLSRW